METAMIVVIIVLIAVSFLGMLKGLDLKKWPSRISLICAFISGMLTGLLRDSPYQGLMLGAIATAFVWYLGATIQWQRGRYNKETARSWLLRNEGKKGLSPLARMIRKVLDK